MTEAEMVTIHRELTEKYGDDVAQETLCRYLSMTETILQPDHFLRRVAYRLFIDETRRRNRIVLDIPEIHVVPGQYNWTRCSEAHGREPVLPWQRFRYVSSRLPKNRSPVHSRGSELGDPGWGFFLAVTSAMLAPHT